MQIKICERNDMIRSNIKINKMEVKDKIIVAQCCISCNKLSCVASMYMALNMARYLGQRMSQYTLLRNKVMRLILHIIYEVIGMRERTEHPTPEEER